MSPKEEFAELENDIRRERRLPYTLTVEKIENDIIYTHNQWGNSVKYRKTKDNHFELLKETE